MHYDSHLYGHSAVSTSKAQAWSGLRVERYQLPAMELPAHYHQHHLLLLHQPNLPHTTQRKRGNQLEEATFQAGDLGLYPGGEYGSVVWNGPSDTIHVYLDDQHLETIARRDLDLAYFNLRDQFCFQDPLLTQIGQQLLSAVGIQHQLGLLYVESLHTALCYHLLTHYASYERRISTKAHLSVAIMARIDAYLESHADGPVTLQLLADIANLSVFHFARCFKQTTGQPPYQYVLHRKIRQAQTMLKAGSASMSTISDQLGFATPAHFSAVFKRIAGQCPLDYQKVNANRKQE